MECENPSKAARKADLVVVYTVGGSTMNKGRHPNVVRAWLISRIQKQVRRARKLMAAPRKWQPHNKT